LDPDLEDFRAFSAIFLTRARLLEHSGCPAQAQPAEKEMGVDLATGAHSNLISLKPSPSGLRTRDALQSESDASEMPT
jgi:hypothetical protein